MPFDEMDFRDLIALLEKHPEWKAELRRVILTEDLLRLPELVAQLAAQVERLVHAVERHELILQRHEQLLQQILEVQYRHEQTLQRHEQLLQQILEVQYRHERRLERLERDIAPLKGMAIEWRIYRHAPAYLGRFIRRCRLLSFEELDDILEQAVDEGRLSDAEADEIRLADCIVSGRSRQDKQEMYLVIEASWGLGKKDVERAVRRAQLFARTGKRATPVVLGSWISPEAKQLAQQAGAGIAIVPYESEEPEEDGG